MKYSLKVYFTRIRLPIRIFILHSLSYKCIQYFNAILLLIVIILILIASEFGFAFTTTILWCVCVSHKTLMIFFFFRRNRSRRIPDRQMPSLNLPNHRRDQLQPFVGLSLRLQNQYYYLQVPAQIFCLSRIMLTIC